MDKINYSEKLPIVNVDGEVVGITTRGEAHGNSKLKPLHPVVHLHVFNSKSEIYLQKRPEWKGVQPGKWDTATGGHVAYGESVNKALIREVKEELGIIDFEPEFIGKYVFESEVEKELVYMFKTIYENNLYPDPDELDGGRFWAEEEIYEAIGKGILTPNFEYEYKHFFVWKK